MSILVTGGAGYIGSHMVKELIRQGREVVVLDNLSTGHREAVTDCPLVEADLFDGAVLNEVMREYSVEGIIHFAASSQVGESMVKPEKYYKNNLGGTLSLLEAMVANNVRNIVFSSTAATFGEPAELPITERCPQRPINVYGRTKLVMEGMLKDFDRAYGIKSVALRYFNAAGADPDGAIGEDHDPESHLIPLIFQTLTGKRQFISIYGDDYPTPDGTCIRDYIHVTDLATAHVLALDALADGMDSDNFNLGNGNGFSVKEVIASVERVTGRKVPAVIGERRAGDPAQLIAGSEKIIQKLGWKPRYADLDQIVATAWAWASKHPNGYSIA
ncbi:MAG: UDP-glucose 4-epimerase GalE [Christensenellales bacterium]